MSRPQKAAKKSPVAKKTTAKKSAVTKGRREENSREESPVTKVAAKKTAAKESALAKTAAPKKTVAKESTVAKKAIAKTSGALTKAVATKTGVVTKSVARAGASLDPHDHLRSVDEKLARVMERAGRSPLSERGKETFDGAQAFKALVHVIVSQQLSGKAADTIFGRVEALGDGQLPTPAQFLALPDEKLRAAGLSGAKTRGVKDLAARVLDGSLQLDTLHAHDDEAVIEALTKVRGIGRWSAEMFLMFRLGRPDVLSTGDLGLRKGLMQLFGLRDLPDPATMERLTEHWRPFRSVGSWYLWRVAEEGPPLRRKEPEKKGVSQRATAKKAKKASRSESVLAKR